MSNYTTQPLKESEERKVKLDNQDITVKEFNEKLEELKPNQRIIETSEQNYHLVERMFS